ncbi:hypothetical protein BH23GEM3_BH23GEM3_08410 [soil metagenome]
MWLLPALDHVSTLTARVYYRLTIAGSGVPLRGPALLVANHPNSLFDAAMVAAAARRPVRFLAKAPLFTDPKIGWLVRASGSIPVYRAVDDAASVHRNDEAFRAAYAVLAGGAAVGIFPEGISHDESSLTRLKTGAARIALGAARLHGDLIPIIPIGLTLRGKEHFRSEALVQIGEPIAWADLAISGSGPAEVKDLTRRIEAALRSVTVNMERWEDAPLIEAAAAVYAAAMGEPPAPAQRVAALNEITAILKRLRQDENAEWEPLARDLSEHMRVLHALGLRPADLRSQPGMGQAVRWTVRQLAFFGLTGAMAAAGAAVFYLPHRITDAAVARLDATPDLRATSRTLGGAFFFGLWIIFLALAVGFAAGVAAGVATLFILPALALPTLAALDRWRGAWPVARRFLLLWKRADLRRDLAARQARIAERLHLLRQRISVVRGL